MLFTASWQLRVIFLAILSCSGTQCCFFFFFFFQAEDGIRDLTVTGVQTCALPISLRARARTARRRQRLGVPTRSATLPEGDRRRHWPGRCRGRPRGLPPPGGARRDRKSVV